MQKSHSTADTYMSLQGFFHVFLAILICTPSSLLPCDVLHTKITTVEYVSSTHPSLAQTRVEEVCIKSIAHNSYSCFTHIWVARCYMYSGLKYTTSTHSLQNVPANGRLTFTLYTSITHSRSIWLLKYCDTTSLSPNDLSTSRISALVLLSSGSLNSV